MKSKTAIAKNLAVIVAVVCVIAVVSILPFAFNHINNAKDYCQKHDGVFFEVRGSTLCLKKEAVIK